MKPSDVDGATDGRSPPAVHPLDELRRLKRRVQIGVYGGIALSEPFYYFVINMTLQEMVPGLIIGLIIAFTAIEGAFHQMFKLRKRSAYPGLLLQEVGAHSSVQPAAGHAITVLNSLLGLSCSAIAMARSPGERRVLSAAGMGAAQAEELLRDWGDYVEAAFRSLAPVRVNAPPSPGHPAEGAAVSVLVPIISFRRPTGVLVLVSESPNADLKDRELLVEIGAALGLGLENLRQTEELRIGEHRMRTTITGAPLVLYAVDAGGVFTFIEGKSLEAMGLRSEDVVGRHFSDAYEATPEILSAFARALDGEEVALSAPLRGITFETRLTPVRDERGTVTGVIGVSWDVTDQRQAELALLQSERMLRTVVSNVPVVLFALDARGIFTLSEGRGLEGLGLKPGQVVGSSIFDVYADSPTVLRCAQRALAGEAFTTVVYVGNLFWETSYSPVFDAHGNVTGVIGVAADVTARERSEEVLRASEARFRSLIENSSDGIALVRGDGQIVYGGPSTERILGYTADEIRGMNAFDLVHPEDLERHARSMGELLLAPGASNTAEGRIRRKDGEWIWIEMTNTNLIHIPDIGAIVVNYRDITARRIADEALRKSEERYRDLFENANDIVYTHDLHGTFLSINRAGERITGYSREEVVGMSFEQLVAPESLALAREMISRQAAGGGSTVYEIEIVTKSGARVPLEVSARPILEDGLPVAVQGVARDITERKAAEEAVRRSEARNRALIDAVPDLMFRIGRDGVIRDCKVEGAYAAFGPAERFIGKHVREILGEEAGKLTLRGVRAALRTGDVQTVEHQAPGPDGTVSDWEGRFVASSDSEVVVIAREITERKQAERALRESEELYRTLIDTSPDAIFFVDLSGRVIKTNKPAVRLLGYRTHRQVEGKSALDFVAEGDRDRVREFVTGGFAADGAAVNLEYTLVTRAGTEVPVELRIARVPDAEGKTRGYIAVARDISERRRAERALRESEEKYRTLVESTNEIIFQLDAAGFVTYISPVVEQIGGYKPEEVVGRHSSDFIHQDDLSEVAASLQRGLAGNPEPSEYRLIAKNGDVHWVRSSSNAIYEGGAVVGLRGVIVDITERKRAEEALRESEERYRTVTELISDYAYAFRVKGPTEVQIEWITEAFTRITGYAAEELEAIGWMALIHPEDFEAARERIANWANGRSDEREIRVVTRSGEVRWIRDQSHTTVGPDGVIRVVGAATDITEQRRAEEALEVSEERYRDLFETASDIVYRHDTTGLYTYINRAAERIFGYSREELLQMRFTDLMPADQHPKLSEIARQLYGGESPSTFELECLSRDGRRVPLEVSARLITENGRAIGVQGIARDISARKQAERSLRALVEGTASATGDEFFRSLVRHVAAAMNTKYAVVGAVDSSGSQLNTLAFWAGDDFAPNVSYDLAGTPCENVLATGICHYPRGVQAQFPEDALLAEMAIESYIGAPLFDSSGRSLGILLVMGEQPIEENPSLESMMTIFAARAGAELERMQAEAALRASEERYRQFVETAQDVIYTLAPDGTITSLNPAFEVITGWACDEWVGKSFVPLVNPDDLPRALDVMTRVVRGENTEFELEIKAKSGEYLTAEFRVTPLSKDGEVVALLGIARDITERKRAESTIRQLAYHDALTGLPNRTLFEDRLRVALAQAHRTGQMLAVMFLDLDHFKIVNDTLGHGDGDRLLRSVAEDLSRLVREGDTVARVGGDEFTLLLPGISGSRDAMEVAERILECLKLPRMLGGHEFQVTTSIGITLYPEDGTDVETLLRNADTAMYRAKERGRDTYQLYSPGMNATILERLALENDLRHALERNELEVYFQPIVNVQSGEITGAEALVRWHHPSRGLVAPDDFIPVAEESGVIVPMGQWILREACRRAQEWRTSGLGPLRVSVNLAARQLQQEDLVNKVAETLGDTGLPLDLLQIEITEGAVMKNVDLIIETLSELRQMGVRIAVDDFGTGYSSLSYLKRFPIDSVKIDQSFVRDLATDPNDAAIVTTVIAMARSLNLKVVAEGVETTGQLDFLRRRGCDEFQGYLVSPPIPAKAFQRLLIRSRRDRAAAVQFGS